MKLKHLKIFHQLLTFVLQVATSDTWAFYQCFIFLLLSVYPGKLSCEVWIGLCRHLVVVWIDAENYLILRLRKIFIPILLENKVDHTVVL